MKEKLLLFLIFLSFQFLSCFSITKEAPKKRYFTIEADQSKIKKNSAFKFAKLRVNKLKINSSYESKEFTYRRDLDFENDFYNQFLTPPPTNITEQIIQWINKSKLSEVVTNRLSSTDSNLLLEGNINSLFADFSGGKIQSVLEIEFYLSDNAKDKILFKKTYSQKINSQDKSPVSILKAWNQALTEILIELEQDLKNLNIEVKNNPNDSKEDIK